MTVKERKCSLLSGNEYTRLLKITGPLMYGEDIKSVQNKLNSLGYSIGIADGYYGNMTVNGVRNFQEDNRLDVDGIVGPKTWNKLFYTSEDNNTCNIKKVFIDPGHGGSDPGASGNGIIESDKVLDISIRLGDLLKTKGIQVKYSRNDNSNYVELSQRAKMANEWGADIFISIHANSFTSSSVYGTETFSYTNGSSKSKDIALKITNAISSSMKLYNRGAKTANFAVIRESNMPAVLIETAFLTNGSDASILKTNPQGFAVAIAKGILGE